MVKVIVLARQVGNRLHLTELKDEVPMHIDLVERVINRCTQRGIVIDCDTLIDSVIAKGVEI